MDAATEESGVDEIDLLIDDEDGNQTSVRELVDQTFRGEQDNIEDMNNLKSLQPTKKVLGVGYLFESDEFCLKIGEKHSRTVITKTDVLSFISSVFDPLGLVCPYVLRGRMLFQQINEINIGWKDKVPDEILVPFNKWKDSIHHLKAYRIPRWTSKLGLEDALTDLVGFSDSGSEAYGVVFYMRKYLQGGGTEAHISFLYAKSHVIPIKMQKKPVKDQECHLDSIPRLELVAAQTSALCRDMLQRESEETFSNIWMFSDSITVLNWIKDFDRRFKTFENFRIQRIRSLTKTSEWRHCPTSLNPADICSRGIEADDAVKFNFFHRGPDFLRKDVSEWPPATPVKSRPDIGENVKSGSDIGENVKSGFDISGNVKSRISSENVASMVKVVIPQSADPNLPDDQDQEVVISPFHLLTTNATNAELSGENDEKEEIPWPLRVACKKSEWRDKVRVVGLVVKVFMKLKKQVEERRNPSLVTRSRKKIPEAKNKIRLFLTPHEREKAELLLIRAIQVKHFSREIESLVKLNVFSPNALKELKTKSSQLRTLSPFLDENNLLRAGGRFGKADYLPFDTRFPMILPGAKDECVRALIRGIHTENMHCSRAQTYYLSRHRFFILGGRTATRSIIDTCVPCQRLSKVAPTQRLGDLPEDRVSIAAPFSVSGLDCFGPMHIRHGRGTCKKWVLMITCMITRAVCLLPLKDMSTTTVINALVKMNSQFPSLKKIYSDQGTNFRGADREMREALTDWRKHVDNDKLADKGIEWHFGPANCGSAGGAWERLIGLTKKLLKSVIGEKTLDNDTFETLLAGAMGIMNRRPLTPATADIDEWMVLSPAHFLYPHEFTNSMPSILPLPTDETTYLRASWKLSRELIQVFWRQWSQTYLDGLRKKAKWRNSSDGPVIGQIVLLTEPDIPRESWRMARVIEIINTDQLHVRRIKVRDASGTVFDRHVTGVVPLELDL